MVTAFSLAVISLGTVLEPRANQWGKKNRSAEGIMGKVSLPSTEETSEKTAPFFMLLRDCAEQIQSARHPAERDKGPTASGR